jgi:cobalt-zinc-cadmium efflux system membrane fusion protein
MYRYTIALTLLMAWGCQQNPKASNQPDAHDNEHSGESSQYTLFSDNAEFFIEHELLEAGEESEFLVHLTHLNSYKPYTSGIVTVEIDGVSATSGEAYRPGIFHVPFIPKKAGAFHLNVSLLSEGSRESVSGHIHVEDHEGEQHEGEETHANASHQHEPPPVGEILFLKEQAWKSNFMVSEVKKGPISTVILTSGEITPAPGKINRVAANIGGIISFENKNLVQGQHVEKGSLLFTISGKSLPQNNFELQVQQARNELEKSRSEYIRHQKLHKQAVLSDRQFINSRARYRSDSLSYYSLAENTSVKGLLVYAPSSGSIHELNVSEGDYVKTGDVLTTLSSDKVLLLRADLPQQFHIISGEIHDANFRLAYTQEAFSISDFKGRHLATGHSAAENDHYLPVYFELQNDGRLLEGAYAEIYLLTDSEQEKIIIPLEAISKEQGANYVYVQVTGESYTKRAIRMGQNNGQIVEVTDGLQAGERIVTLGPMLIKAASMVSGAVGDGHSH